MSAISRRQFLGGSALAALGLSGCAARRVEAPGVVTLNFYNYATPEFLELYNEKLIPAFEKRYPKIKIRMTTSLGDAGYDAKLLTLIAGKLAPDLFHVTQQNFPFYAAKKVLMPIDESLRKDTELTTKDFYPQVTQGMRYEGKLMGLPSDFSTIIAFYNQDLFDRYNVPYPKDDWTWDDYLETCKALTHDSDRDGHRDVYGTVNLDSYNRWPAWVWMNGGDILSPDGKRCVLDSPAAIEGLKFYVDLSTRHNVSPTPGQSMGQGFQELFTSQTAAIITDSRYAYKKFLRGKGLPFRWDVAPMPRHKTQATTFIWGGNCIYHDTPHPDEAWQFLKFLSGPEGAALNLEGGNALPAYRRAADAEIDRPKNPKTPRHDAFFRDAIRYGRTAPTPEAYADFTQALSGLHDAYLGLTSVEEACRAFTIEVNRVLKMRES